MEIKTPKDYDQIILTADGSLTLSHPEHGEAYHSSHGARSEALELYIDASELKNHFSHSRDTTSILDVGLGLGYNAITTIETWLEASNPGSLRVLSLEIDSNLVSLLKTGNAAWQKNWSLTQREIAQTLGKHCIAHPKSDASCTWNVFIGDAMELSFTESFNFIWQDPFSPSKNPRMWSFSWFEKLKNAAAPSCILMTYSVARTVRDALTESGWNIERIPTGTGRKRHWLRAINTI